MSPRNTQQGASASARKAPVRRRASAASSARTSTSRKPASTRATTSSRSKSAPARPKPTSGRTTRDASWFRWWLLPLFVIAAVAIFAVTYYPVARVQYSETRKRAALQAELKSLQTRDARLSTEVARLKTPEGVEDYARSQLGMVKQGEHVVVVTDGTKKPSTLTTAGSLPAIDTSVETTAAPNGPWTAFLDSVFKVQ
jgi:cell division protein FtsL